jgi:ABC-2 type transport system permease protein
MGNLLKRLFSRHRLFLAADIALLAGLEYMICAIVSTIDLPAVLSQLMKNMPPFLRVLIEESFGGFGAANFLAFGWNHPIALAIGAAAAIVLAVRAVAGEVEAGTIETLLSQPLSRMRYFGANVLFALLSLASLGGAAALATMAGQRIYGVVGGLSPAVVLALALNYFLLQFTWYGLALLVSVFGREAGRVAFAGFLLILVSYLVLVIAQLWPAAAFLRPYSINAYYDPQTILRRQGVPTGSAAVLLGLGAAGLGLALWRFRRRDIP